MEYKIKKDTMGEVKVPADKYWGAQTQRSINNFKIGKYKMPVEIIRAYAYLKKAAANANCELGTIEDAKRKIISDVCDEILAGKLDDNFPLVIFQTGSGTQTNMNVNEVIANRGNEIWGEEVLHPNDDVNKSQSSNDTFPTAMHIAAVLQIQNNLLPNIAKLRDTFCELEKKYEDVIKIGRTHLQDATPITLGQEISGWRSMLDHNILMIDDALKYIMEVGIGGTAVGTGLNAPKDFDKIVVKNLSDLTGEKFKASDNKFHDLTSKDALVNMHGALTALAANLMKIANDIRLLSSGPRCGIGEFNIPENEPGSSIMPGKVNPTQCEALTMVCVKVMGNNTVISIAASQGNFELNVYMPLIISSFLESAELLADAIHSFNDNCAVGIKPNYDKIEDYLENSLMLVTALNPYIGYEKAAKVTKLAYKDHLTIREAIKKLGLLSENEIDEILDPNKMICK